MDKRLYAIIALTLVGVLGYFFLIPKCEQPDRFTVIQAQIACLKDFNADSFRKEVCKIQYETEDCLLLEIDDKVIENIFFKKINTCAKAALVSANLCTDKYQDMGSE